MEKYGVAVIGGGAAGLIAAIFAAESKTKVVVLEKNPRTGKKLLKTGNGRCNLSHSPITAEHYHGEVELFKKIHNKWQKLCGTESFFHSLGLYTFADDEGRVYPRSNTAAAVSDALRLRLVALGASEKCGFSVKNVEKSGDGFVLTSENGEKILAARVIVAAGGYAAAETGSDGDGARLARLFGHKPTEPLPSLAPLKTDPNAVKALKGLRVRARASLFDGKRLVKSESGEVQFTENSLSGICVFNLSGLAVKIGKGCEISLDLAEDMTADGLYEALVELRSLRANAEAADFLTGLFQKRICTVLLGRCGISQTALANEIADRELRQLAELIKAWHFPVVGFSPFSAAQTTAGGIAARELTDCLESRLCGGLYFAGEVIDVDGDCGGYNLEWAWASGAVAGVSASEDL